eukprot:XP_017170369.1 PREDICTED: uncharacterized protein LOC108167339 [Mus musculus]
MGSRPSRGPLRALGGPRPGPRGERPGAPGPDNHHTKEAWTGSARLSYREALARNAAAKRDERLPVWVSQLSPAGPRSHSAYPWTPFSRLPPRSLNVRLLLAFPLGAALRRRETRNLGRYHRARPRGWPKRSEPELFGSSLPKPLTRSSPKEPDVTSGLKKKGASGASAPVSEGYPRTRELLGARRGGSEWLRPLALGTVSEESALEGDGGWREGWGKGSRPA